MASMRGSATGGGADDTTETEARTQLLRPVDGGGARDGSGPVGTGVGGAYAGSSGATMSSRRIGGRGSGGGGGGAAYGATPPSPSSEGPGGSLSLEALRAQSRRETRAFAYKATAAVVGYFALGVLVYSLAQKTSFTDALYFCVVTLTTVGYGDLVSSGPGLKLFACAYIVFGLWIVASLLSFLVGSLLDKQEHLLANVLESGAEALEEILGADDSDTMVTESKGGAVVVQRRSQAGAACATASSTLLFVGLLAVSAVVFGYLMDLGVVDAVYFTLVSASTVGYGDFSPESTGARWAAIFLLPLLSLSLAKALGDFAQSRLDEKRSAMLQRIVRRTIDRKAFKSLDQNHDGRIGRDEFLAGTLIEQGKVTRADVAAIYARFEDLDSNRDGRITGDEIGLQVA